MPVDIARYALGHNAIAFLTDGYNHIGRSVSLARSRARCVRPSVRAACVLGHSLIHAVCRSLFVRAALAGLIDGSGFGSRVGVCRCVLSEVEICLLSGSALAVRSDASTEVSPLCEEGAAVSKLRVHL